ncbi:hypothetical protein OROGR_002549 [Orobanche gracilis]
MEITNQDFNGFLDWKTKTKNLKKKIFQLESKEMKDVMAYYSVMQNACMQFAGFVAISSIMPNIFREIKYFLVLGMVLTFILFIIYPLYFGIKKLQRLKCSTREAIVERKRLYESCMSLMGEYNKICAVASPFKDTQDLLLKEFGDVEMENIKNFKKEDADLVYQTKYYQKFLLLMGIVGIIYAVGFIGAFYVFFQIGLITGCAKNFTRYTNQSQVSQLSFRPPLLLLGYFTQVETRTCKHEQVPSLPVSGDAYL